MVAVLLLMVKDGWGDVCCTSVGCDVSLPCVVWDGRVSLRGRYFGGKSIKVKNLPEYPFPLLVWLFTLC